MQDHSHDSGEFPKAISGLPVAGYRPQSEQAVGTVNAFKEIEEQVLRLLDELKADADLEADQRWLAAGRTQIEVGFMMVNRSVFKPARVDVPDPARPAKAGWLLERADTSPAQPLYYSPAAGAHCVHWSVDHRKALRLLRRSDAVALADALGVECRIAEHQWS